MTKKFTENPSFFLLLKFLETIEMLKAVPVLAVSSFSPPQRGKSEDLFPRDETMGFMALGVFLGGYRHKNVGGGGGLKNRKVTGVDYTVFYRCQV